MQFLANENFPLKSVLVLRSQGHDVAATIELAPGSSDRTVLRRAAEEDRIVLTFDRDYGELIYKQGLAVPSGIIYFRFIPRYPEEPAERLIALLDLAELSLTQMFTVLERDQIRQRPLSSTE